MTTRRRYTGLRPNVDFEVCPPLRSLGARWGLQHLLHELYWKSAHFRGLGRRFGQRQHRELHAWLGQRTAHELCDGADAVDQVLTQACGLARCPPDSVASWRRSETALNARLTFACSMAGPERCAGLFAPLLPDTWGAAPLHPARLVGWLDERRRDATFGQPDLLLIGERQLVMVEMKVRGAATTAAKYDAGQLLKYAGLARYARTERGIGAIAHLILAPAATNGDVFYRQEAWVERVDPASGAVRFHLEHLSDGARVDRWRRAAADPTTRSLVEAELETMAVRLRSYEQLADSAAHQPGDWPFRAAVLRQLERLREYAAEPLPADAA